MQISSTRKALTGLLPARLLAAVLVLVLAASCSRAAAPAPAPGNAAGTAVASAPLPNLDVPRKDLSPQELADFAAGKALFAHDFKVEEGLGPHFNAASCVACHFAPNSGGHGDMKHAARIAQIEGDVDGLPLQAIPGFAPLQPNPGQVTSMHKPPALFGLGLVEAIPDAELASQCGKDAALGIEGKANYNAGLHTHGRFGYKAHAPTLQDFIANAMSLEMGLMNPVERDPRHQRDTDAVPDPETATSTVEQISAYVRGLAPPPRAKDDPEGQKLFVETGCAHCHRPETGKNVFAFSDFCIHDLGAGFDNGLTDFDAKPTMWRTAPLWGLRFREAYFHDNRAKDLDSAIRLHAGEALKVRQRYEQLPAAQQARLQAFLRTL